MILSCGILTSNCLVGEGGKKFNFFFLPGSNLAFPGDGSNASGGDGNAPIIPVTPVPPTGTLTYSTAATFYVSGNAGAIQYYDISWSSNMGASYELRKNATNCSTGSIHTNGTVTASTSNTDRFNAGDLSAGSNGIKLCLKSPDGSSDWDNVTINGVRDDSAPSIVFNPLAGTFGSGIPNIDLTCNDTGPAGCLKTAYRNDGTAPTIGADGTVGSGSTAYSVAFAVANNATTNVQVVAVDKAGNVGTNSSQYVVAVGNPTITINSVSRLDMNSTGSDNSDIKWQSDIAGNYELRLGGTNCNSGTNGTALSITGTAAAATEITTNIAASTLAVGANTIRICLTTAGSNVGYNSKTLNIDNTAPVVTSATPSNNSLSLSVDQNDFILTFNEDMDTSTTPLPKQYDSGTSPNFLVPWPTMTGTWTDARTYKVSMNSKLPEWHAFYLLFNDTNFKDKAGNKVAGAYVASNQIRLNYRTIIDTKVTKITDTAQTNCYDASGSLLVPSCAGSGQDGNLSVMPYGLGTPVVYNTSYPNDIVTRDTVNNTFWKTCPPAYIWNGTTCVIDTVGAYNSALISKNTAWIAGMPDLTWYDAIEYCLQLNLNNSGAGFAGLKTWRLPTLSEQMSILIYEGSVGNETIPASSFPGFIRNDYQRYWTSTNAVTANSLDGYTSSAALGNGANAWGAWQISVFGGGTHMINKGVATSWSAPTYSNYAMCIAD